MKISFEPLDYEAAAFISHHTGIDYTHAMPFNEPRWFCGTARDGEAIAGVVLAEFVNHFEAWFTAAVVDPRCMTKKLLRSIFTALFSRAVRLTAFIDVDNERAQKNARHMGFWQEGYCRLGINGVTDAYVFGMLKPDCPFLPSYVPPSAMGADIPDSVLRDIETHSKIARGIRRGSDSQNIDRRKGGVRGKPSGSVDELVGHVAEPRVPPDVSLVDAVSPVTAMARLVRRG